MRMCANSFCSRCTFELFWVVTLFKYTYNVMIRTLMNDLRRTNENSRDSLTLFVVKDDHGNSRWSTGYELRSNYGDNEPRKLGILSIKRRQSPAIGLLGFLPKTSWPTINETKSFVIETPVARSSRE